MAAPAVSEGTFCVHTVLSTPYLEVLEVHLTKVPRCCSRKHCSLEGPEVPACRCPQDASIMISVPESFVFPEKDRPTVPHNSFDHDLPVIDLSPVVRLDKLQRDLSAGIVGVEATKKEIQDCESQVPGTLQKMRWACEKFGTFQVVNHGSPMEYIEQLIATSHRFFAKPVEEKQKVNISIRGFSNRGYFFKRHPYSTDPAERWQEGLSVPIDPNEHLTDLCAALMWPDLPARSKETSELYKKQGLAFEAVSCKILELLAQSLGLSDTAYYTKGFADHGSMNGIRVQHYPICPRPDLTMGHPPHTDHAVITLLYQDAVGGLQVLSDDGTWLGVKPYPGAFVVLVGDLLQAWTNDRFKCVIHRAVTNSEKARLSILFYQHPERDAVVVAPPELVDSEHPALYRAFTGDEYYKALFSPQFRDRRLQDVLPSFRQA